MADAVAAHDAPTIAVRGVDFVLLPTRDLDRAADFYAGQLGLERGKLWQRGESPAMGAEFEAPGLTIAIAAPEAIGREFQPHSQPIALRVDDVHEARAALEQRGVEFVGDVIDSGVCHMTFLADPDGNALMLHRRYASHD